MQGERDRLTFTTGERIEWLMGRRGRKPGELRLAIETAAGRKMASWLRYRTDERPIPDWVLRYLADELRTTTDFLLGRTDDPTPGTYSRDADKLEKLGRPVRGMPIETNGLALSAAG
jgi:hypothetical protein